jgi:hypothetical protein
MARPLDWCAVEIEPGLYLPDWELMLENEGRIRLALRAHFEANLDKVSATPDY